MKVDPFASRGIMRTNNGWMNLTNPDPADIDLDDIAMSLNRMVRFTGRSDISVLSHLNRCYDLARVELGIKNRQLLRTVLLHDAHEAYCVDLSSPMKHAMRLTYPGDEREGILTDYDHLEAKLMVAMAKRFDLIYPHPPEVKQADMMALSVEVEMTWGRSEVELWGLQKMNSMWATKSNRSDAIKRFNNNMKNLT